MRVNIIIDVYKISIGIKPESDRFQLKTIFTRNTNYCYQCSIDYNVNWLIRENAISRYYWGLLGYILVSGQCYSRGSTSALSIDIRDIYFSVSLEMCKPDDERTGREPRTTEPP